MVAHETPKRKTVSNFSSKYVLFGLIFCLAFAVVLVGIYIIYGLTKGDEESPVEDFPEIHPSYTPEDFEPKLPDAINFQLTIDSFVNSTTGNRSVIVYDVERDEIAGSYNTEEPYNTASLYKLFVVYEGYRRIQNGVWDPNATIVGRSVLKCLDLAIRESYSPCAETLWNMIGHAELDSIIRTDFGIVNSNISGLLSNVNDILAIMKLFYNHPDFDREDLIATMKDSFLNQPPTTYNWRQGLPSGFTRANVYNKVGWDYNPNGYWNIYHDTAIIEFPEQDRHFIVVVMTNRVPFQKIREFGTNFENYYYSLQN